MTQALYGIGQGDVDGATAMGKLGYIPHPRPTVLPAMRRTSPHPTTLPDSVAALLWEYDAALDWETDRELIIHRVLLHGNWDAVCWLRGQLGDSALRAWILAHDGGSLSPRQLRFWELVLDLPAGKVDTWVARRQASVWEKRR